MKLNEAIHSTPIPTVGGRQLEYLDGRFQKLQRVDQVDCVLTQYHFYICGNVFTERNRPKKKDLLFTFVDIDDVNSKAEVFRHVMLDFELCTEITRRNRRQPFLNKLGVESDGKRSRL